MVICEQTHKSRAYSFETNASSRSCQTNNTLPFENKGIDRKNFFPSENWLITGFENNLLDEFEEDFEWRIIALALHFLGGCFEIKGVHNALEKSLLTPTQENPPPFKIAPHFLNESREAHAFFQPRAQGIRVVKLFNL